MGQKKHLLACQQQTGRAEEKGVLIKEKLEKINRSVMKGRKRRGALLLSEK